MPADHPEPAPRSPAGAGISSAVGTPTPAGGSLAELAKSEGRSATRQQDLLVRGRMGIASSLFAALRCKHAPTATHCLRVALSASKWAAVLAMPETLRSQFEMAALLHDIGKLGVPDAVLHKPGRLLPEEMELVDRHPEFGAGILRSARAPEPLVETVLACAAWYDGSHRRVKLAAGDIPVFARMLAIADAYDAMTTDHVYRPAKSRERAIAELFEYAGRQFDPGLVGSFADHFDHDQRALEEEVATRWVSANAADALPWELHEPPASGASAERTPQPRSPHQLFEQKLIDNMHDGVVFVDAQRRVLLWNTGAERLTGVAAGAAVGRQLKPALLEMADRSGREVRDERCPIARAIANGLQVIENVTVVGRTGHHVAVDLHAIPVGSRDGLPRGATVLLHDASSEATLRAKCQALHAETTKDPLTQVANRAEFDRMLAAFVDAHQDTALPCSLIMADIDHFKQINDTYGHQAGDEVIISFAALLKSKCRAGDLVARYGGEEFAVLCADCNNAGGARRAEELRKCLAELQHSELSNRAITASFGVTELQTGDTPDTMLRRADRALLLAKDQGRNQVVQLGDGMPSTRVRRPWWPFRLNRGRTLIDTTLVTNVPLEVAIQKLRGFIADRDAKILEAGENDICLEVVDQVRNRRRDDRPVTFIIDVQLSQRHEEHANAAGFATGSYVHTSLAVTIRPRRDRDRRRGVAAERARMVLGSLKSYLMAKEPAEATDRSAEPAGAAP